MEVVVEGGQCHGTGFRRRAARFQDPAGDRLDMAQAVRARRVQRLGVLERRHDGQQGVEAGLRLRRAGRAGDAQSVQRPPNVRKSGPRLARAPTAPYFADTEEPREASVVGRDDGVHTAISGAFFCHLRILSKLTTAPPRPGLLPMVT